MYILHYYLVVCGSAGEKGFHVTHTHESYVCVCVCPSKREERKELASLASLMHRQGLS